MSTPTHDHDDPGNFEHGLLLALTQADRTRPVVSPEAGPVRRFRPPNRVWRPAALGVVAALALAGAVVASGVLSPRGFEAAHGVQVAGDQLAAKGSGCASNATVTVSIDGQEVGTVIAGTDGDFSASVPIPATVTVGQHQAQASCVDAAGSPVVQTAPITIAATRPPLGPVFNANYVEGVPGGQVAFKVGPLKAGSDVTITLDGRAFTTVHAAADGWLDATLTLPADTTIGSHWFRATGTVPDGRTFDQSTEVVVVSR